MDSVIKVKNLTKHFSSRIKKPGLSGAIKAFFKSEYKHTTAVDNISFEIQQGEIVGLIGPNGAGKSTTIKMLTGILFPTKGTIRVLGLEPQEERIELAYQLGTIFGQRQQLTYHLPATDSFNLFAKIYDLKEEDYQERLQELVKIFELEPYLNVPVRKLSLGERMRCEFVAALLHNPKVLL